MSRFHPHIHFSSVRLANAIHISLSSLVVGRWLKKNRILLLHNFQKLTNLYFQFQSNNLNVFFGKNVFLKTFIHTGCSQLVICMKPLQSMINDSRTVGFILSAHDQCCQLLKAQVPVQCIFNLLFCTKLLEIDPNPTYFGERHTEIDTLYMRIFVYFTCLHRETGKRIYKLRKLCSIS